MKLTMLTALSSILFAIGCSLQVSRSNSSTLISSESKPRNIILVIGDGMGPQQMALAELYAQYVDHRALDSLSQFRKQAELGVHLPSAANALVNDSACSATQLSSACDCKPRQVGLTPQGERCESIFRVAKARGMKTGLVSDTRITHATPAAFYAHSTDRDSEYAIAEQLVESDVDLALSGGSSLFLPQKSTCSSDSCQGVADGSGDRVDGRNLIQRWQARGYPVVRDATELASSLRTPLLGLFAGSCMHDAFHEGMDDQPTLAAMTQAALRLLDNPNGFILMVEAGQIDFAGHQNDGGWVLAEMLRLNTALAVIEEFTRDRDDTLVLLTGDHETGGMGFSYYHPAKPKGSARTSLAEASQAHDVFVETDTLKILRGQKAPIMSISKPFEKLPMEERTPERLRDLVRKVTGYPINSDVSRSMTAMINRQAPDDVIVDTLFTPFYSRKSATSALLGRALGAHLGLTWSTGTHTSTPIFVLSSGPGSSSFKGWFQTREIGKLLKDFVTKRNIRG